MKWDAREMVEPFARASREVRSAARRLEALVGRRNTPTVGAYREAFVRGLIRAHLPEGLECGSGFVLSPRGEISRQVDVVVYEAGAPFAEGGFVVCDLGRVRAVVEVKSRLARGSFLGALGELTRLKGWAREAGGASPLYAALVAFRSASAWALMRAAQDFYGGRLSPRCGPPLVVDLVAVVGAWSLVAGWLPWPASAGRGDLEIPALASLLSASGGEDSSLHLLVAGLLAHLESAQGLGPRAGPLLDSYRPLTLPFGQPAVCALGSLSGVEPAFLSRHDEVFRHRGLALDLARGLILKAS